MTATVWSHLLSEQLTVTCREAALGCVLTQGPQGPQLPPVPSRSGPVAGTQRGGVGSGRWGAGGPLVHAARSVGPASPRVSSPQFSSLKFGWTGLCQSHPAPTLCGPDPAPRNTNAACSKVDSLRKNGACFSFSYPCLGFYSTPISIPSTLQNKPKQPPSSEDFFPVRWHDWVRCQPREPRARCQSPELGSSCQRHPPPPKVGNKLGPTGSSQTREAWTRSCCTPRGPARDTELLSLSSPCG